MPPNRRALSWRGAGADRAIVMLLAAIMLSPALWNGYPLVHSDTGTYVDSAFTGDVPSDRPVFYGLFLAATLVRLTPWGTNCGTGGNRRGADRSADRRAGA